MKIKNFHFQGDPMLVSRRAGLPNLIFASLLTFTWNIFPIAYLNSNLFIYLLFNRHHPEQGGKATQAQGVTECGRIRLHFKFGILKMAGKYWAEKEFHKWEVREKKLLA